MPVRDGGNSFGFTAQPKSRWFFRCRLAYSVRRDGQNLFLERRRRSKVQLVPLSDREVSDVAVFVRPLSCQG